jgi:Protein of unknown function (DUF1573)
MKQFTDIFIAPMLIFTLSFDNIYAQKNTYEEKKTPLENATAPKIPKEKSGYPKFEKTAHDLGQIYRGQRFRLTYPFKNDGQGVLKINNLNSSCGCVQFQPESVSEIAPGASGNILIDFDSSIFVGNTQRTILVESNSMFKPIVTLSVSAQILQEIEPELNIINFGNIYTDVPVESLLNIKLQPRIKDTFKATKLIKPIEGLLSGFTELSSSVREKILSNQGPLEVIHVKTSSSLLQAETEIVSNEKLGEENRILKLKVMLKGTIPVGAFRENVTLWNNSNYLKQLVIPILGEVASHVKASQQYVEFGVVPVGTSSRRSVTLVSDNDNFKVLGVEVNLKRNDALNPKLKEEDIVFHQVEQNGKSAIMNFELKASSKIISSPRQNANTSGFFLIRTNDNDMKEIKIPFFGVVRSEKQPRNR